MQIFAQHLGVVDAVMAGEDTFECPDQEAYDWKRTEVDDFNQDSLFIISHYSKDYPHPDYVADDDKYAKFWECQVEEFLPDENKFRCTTIDENGKEIHIEIGYTD